MVNPRGAMEARTNQLRHRSHYRRADPQTSVGQGLTQMTWAAEISVTYQQLQKYELGVSRVSASRLYDIAKVLKVPVSSFYPAP